jgi:glucokinase
MNREVAIGIDIGGTNTAFGVVDREGNLLTEGNIPTAGFAEPEPYVAAVHEQLEAIMRTVARVTLRGVGIGAPNGNYYNGTIEFAPNLRWKGVIRIADLFRKYYPLPVKVTNDANAAAIGEMVYGGARGMRDFIVITLGTGLGSGIVANGELVYGHDGFAGELGHTIVDPNGRQCACGRKGCLETYASAPGIKRTVFALLAERTEESKMRSISFNDLTAAMISRFATEGDPIACAAFEYTGKVLGLKLADAVAHTSPEAIFLFGGLANAGELIFEPTRRFMEEYLLKIFQKKVKILPSGLQGKNVAVLGASALLWNELDKKGC